MGRDWALYNWSVLELGEIVSPGKKKIAREIRYFKINPFSQNSIRTLGIGVDADLWRSDPSAIYRNIL